MARKLSKSEAIIRLMDEARRENQPTHTRAKRLFGAFKALDFDGEDVRHVMHYLDMIHPHTLEPFSPYIVRDAMTGVYAVRK
jgi:hypothetical protein